MRFTLVVDKYKTHASARVKTLESNFSMGRSRDRKQSHITTVIHHRDEIKAVCVRQPPRANNYAIALLTSVCPPICQHSNSDKNVAVITQTEVHLHYHLYYVCIHCLTSTIFCSNVCIKYLNSKTKLSGSLANVSNEASKIVQVTTP
ncbi:hypothetical protein V1478_012827 [Vespula squamosa]|uniref:Uncharacterized protein n=1 Tax=Vespula squamosa TaxID=30214 RepID=A0ABD2A9Y8_VESSQ